MILSIFSFSNENGNHEKLEPEVSKFPQLSFQRNVPIFWYEKNLGKKTGHLKSHVSGNTGPKAAFPQVWGANQPFKQLWYCLYITLSTLLNSKSVKGEDLILSHFIQVRVEVQADLFMLFFLCVSWTVFSLSVALTTVKNLWNQGKKTFYSVLYSVESSANSQWPQVAGFDGALI